MFQRYASLLLVLSFHSQVLWAEHEPAPGPAPMPPAAGNRPPAQGPSQTQTAALTGLVDLFFPTDSLGMPVLTHPTAMKGLGFPPNTNRVKVKEFVAGLRAAIASNDPQKLSAAKEALAHFIMNCIIGSIIGEANDNPPVDFRSLSGELKDRKVVQEVLFVLLQEAGVRNRDVVLDIQGSVLRQMDLADYHARILEELANYPALRRSSRLLSGALEAHGVD